EGRKANDSHADCYQYFCVPEYGTANGRLHFHAVHFMRTLPTGSVDPNFGRRVRNRRQLNSLQNTWPYGYSMPIAVRYTQEDRKSGSAGMPRPISYAVFCLKKKKLRDDPAHPSPHPPTPQRPPSTPPTPPHSPPTPPPTPPA